MDEWMFNTRGLGLLPRGEEKKEMAACAGEVGTGSEGVERQSKVRGERDRDDDLGDEGDNMPPEQSYSDAQGLLL